MRVVPSLEILGGKAVTHALNGPGDPIWLDKTPDAIAQEWVDAGVHAIDLVDLDGLYRGAPGLLTIVREVAGSLGVLIQIGGGIRTIEHARDAFAAGVNRVCIGTMAMEKPDLMRDLVSHWPDRVVVTFLIKDDQVPTCTWSEDKDIRTVARQLRSWGVTRFLVVDTDRRPTDPPRVDRIETIAQEVGVRMTIGGDLHDLAQVEAIRHMEPLGVDELLLRSSLHEGRIGLVEAIESLAR